MVVKPDSALAFGEIGNVNISPKNNSEKTIGKILVFKLSSYLGGSV